MSEDDLTRPERAAQIGQAKRYRRQIIERGGCAFCIHRDREVLVWGRSVCSDNRSRAFPFCLKDGRKPEFEVDEETLKGVG